MENSKEKRTCANCKYYIECVKGRFGNVPDDACKFSDMIIQRSTTTKNEE
jgi:hypothetical protein